MLEGENDDTQSQYMIMVAENELKTEEQLRPDRTKELLYGDVTNSNLMNNLSNPMNKLLGVQNSNPMNNFSGKEHSLFHGIDSNHIQTQNQTLFDFIGKSTPTNDENYHGRMHNMERSKHRRSKHKSHSKRHHRRHRHSRHSQSHSYLRSDTSDDEYSTTSSSKVLPRKEIKAINKMLEKYNLDSGLRHTLQDEIIHNINRSRSRSRSDDYDFFNDNQGKSIFRDEELQRLKQQHNKELEKGKRKMRNTVEIITAILTSVCKVMKLNFIKTESLASDIEKVVENGEFDEFSEAMTEQLKNTIFDSPFCGAAVLFLKTLHKSHNKQVDKEIQQLQYETDERDRRHEKTLTQMNNFRKRDTHREKIQAPNPSEIFSQEETNHSHRNKEEQKDEDSDNLSDSSISRPLKRRRKLNKRFDSVKGVDVPQNLTNMMSSASGVIKSIEKKE